jgi:hypothetical protein
MGDSPTPDLESLIKFHKRRQLFIGTPDETLSVVAKRQQSRLFVLRDPRLKDSPNSIQLC